MANQTLNAANNPELANQLLQQAMYVEASDQQEPARIELPSDTAVTLPGGYVTSSGEVLTTAEVRELNGKDEEQIIKSGSSGKALLTTLRLGTVSVGGKPVNDIILDTMLSGDRDALLLGIYKATFGSTATLYPYCTGCEEYKTLEVDLNDEIKVITLDDVQAARKFEVKGRKNTYTLMLPNGKLQKEVLNSDDKTIPELTSIILRGVVLSINGESVISPSQVDAIGLADRRILMDAINEKSFGPQFDPISATCPDCGGKVVSPINLGNLFRF